LFLVIEDPIVPFTPNLPSYQIAGERDPFVIVSIELPARSANQLTKSPLFFQDSGFGFREVLPHQTPTTWQIEHDIGHSRKR
jgi:hypothetical protein